MAPSWLNPRFIQNLTRGNDVDVIFLRCYISFTTFLLIVKTNCTKTRLPNVACKIDIGAVIIAPFKAIHEIPQCCLKKK